MFLHNLSVLGFFVVFFLSINYKTFAQHFRKAGILDALYFLSAFGQTSSHLVYTVLPQARSILQKSPKLE